MNLRRVLMTTDTVGGVWTFTVELAAALAARDIEVVLVAFGGKASESQRSEASEIPGLCLLDSNFKLEWMEEPWEEVEESGRWLTQLAAEYRPDVLHLNTFGHGHLQWTAPVVLTAHSCVLSWWQAVKGASAPDSWDRYRWQVSRSLTSVDLVTAPSCAMASALSTHYGSDLQACRVIPNGRSSSKFYRAEKEQFILTAGRLWDEAKNVQALAQIAPDLLWPVYLAGDSGLDSARGCRALGRLPSSELSDWYSRAAIYAMPARYEPFGLSILEAALSGCALMLGDIPSLREIWEGAAVFIPPNDPEALRKALEMLIGHKSDRENFSQRAYTRALTFSPTRCADAYLETYADAIARRSRQCVS